MKHEAEKAAGLKVFVGGLPHTATEEEIREVVEPHGSLKKGRYRYRSRRFPKRIWIHCF